MWPADGRADPGPAERDGRRGDGFPPHDPAGPLAGRGGRIPADEPRRVREARPLADQAKARAEGRFPGRRPSLTEQQREYIRVERSKGVSQRELAKLLEVSRWTIQQVDG